MTAVQRPIFCEKLHETLEGLRFPPLPGPLGERIYQHISEKAWQLWLAHQTMLINEYRLSLMDPKAQTFLMQEAEKFFFGTGSEKPTGYTEVTHE
ncbi:MAG: oxidative damage protection protein [Gammaproteobacteria bacterium RIFCSPHIGHO2_12_FULL_45_9]|nr:MAG: oxidative damage protection protein [Gammaproteobacteria bacterium RIFCSPHIGHO2_12_FULL_45_9]